jgi:hypothetical protein
VSGAVSTDARWAQLRDGLTSRPVIGVVCFLLGAALALYLGRTGPTIERREREQVHEKAHDVQASVDTANQSLALQSFVAAAENKNLVVHVHRKRTTTPDGHTTDEQDLTLQDKGRVTATTATQATATATQERIVYRDVVKEVERVREVQVKVSPALAQWRAGLLVGVNLPGLGSPLAPVGGPLAYGLGVERRLLGPVWFGAWALSSLQCGIALSVEF